jgi:hypothetical protein
MNAPARFPGHDGFPPELIEARDPYGKGKRSAPVAQNVNASRIEWLAAHDVIQPHQLEAGRRLQQDWNMGQIAGYATLSALPGSGGSQRPADARLDALSRVGAACKALGGPSCEDWRVVYFVVIEEVTLGEVERRHKAPRGSASGALRVALNVLARFYGLLTTST